MCVCVCVCVCTGDHDGLWIQCDVCLAWMHGECVGVRSKAASRKHYTCSRCLRDAALTRVTGPCGATLVVCPAAILQQWWNEIHRHVRPGTLKVVVYLVRLTHTHTHTHRHTRMGLSVRTQTRLYIYPHLNLRLQMHKFRCRYMRGCKGGRRVCVCVCVCVCVRVCAGSAAAALRSAGCYWRMGRAKRRSGGHPHTHIPECWPTRQYEA